MDTADPSKVSVKGSIPLVGTLEQKMKKLLAFCMIGFAFCIIVGCTQHNDPTVMATNKAILGTSGEYVGTLPDGRKIVRYRLEMGDNIHDHWVYVTEGSITINRTENHGKTRSNHVDVIIDGVKYAPVVEEQ